MANAYSIIHQNRKITDPIDLNFTNKVLSYKQGKYDKNLAEIEQTLGQVASLNLRKDVDKKYLGERLNSMLNSVNNSGVLDLSNKGVANDINSSIMSVIDDKVLNAYSTTANLNSKVKEMQELVKKNPELYAKQNADLFNKQIEEYMSSDEVGQQASFQSYIPYNDYNKEVNEGISKWVKDMGVMNYERYITGKDDRMYKVTGETVDSDQLSSAYDMMVTPDMMMQMSIDADFKYKGISDEKLKQNFDNINQGKIKYLQKQITNKSSGLNDLEDVDKRLVEQEIQDLKDNVIELENLNFDRSKNATKLYMDSYKNGILDTYGIDRVTKTELTTDILDYNKKLLENKKLQAELDGLDSSKSGFGKDAMTINTIGDVDKEGKIDTNEDAFEKINNVYNSSRSDLVNKLKNSSEDVWRGTKLDRPSDDEGYEKLISETLNGLVSEDGTINLNTNSNNFNGILTSDDILNYLSSYKNVKEEQDLVVNALSGGVTKMIDAIVDEVSKPNSRINYQNFYQSPHHRILNEYIEKRRKAKLNNQVYTPSKDEMNAVLVDTIDSLNIMGAGSDYIPDSMETKIMSAREQLYKSLPRKMRDRFATKDIVEASSVENLYGGIYNVVKGSVDNTLGHIADFISRNTLNPYKKSYEGSEYENEQDKQINRGMKQLGRVTFERSGTTDSNLSDIQDRDFSEGSRMLDSEGNSVLGSKDLALYLGQVLETAKNNNIKDKVKDLPSSRQLIIKSGAKKGSKSKLLRDNAETLFKQRSKVDLDIIKKYIDESNLTVQYEKDSDNYSISFTGIKKAGDEDDATITVDKNTMLDANLGGIVDNIDTRIINYKYDPINNPTVVPIKISHSLDTSSTDPKKLTTTTVKKLVTKPITVDNETKSFAEFYPNLAIALSTRGATAIKYKPVVGRGYQPYLSVGDADIEIAGLSVLPGVFNPSKYTKATPGLISLAIKSLLNNKNDIYLSNIEQKLSK